ncbi:Autophagy-related protein 13 [Macleaya cordata]|uniref:Autophagy-related protein 13 n=1 Tax=Macleaya cordata TaxID=56857 RepID=A0A200PV52_MACCD|nr:Autophagy-related protein 13 [Macleaya cordata]
MASSSEPAKIEQIITEFFAKSLHIILESRSPCVSSRNYSGEQTLSSPSSSSSSSSSVRPRDKWFNLALRECPAALENLELWHQSNLEPMVVDVILIQRPVNFDSVPSSPKRGLVRNLSSKEKYPNCWNSEQDEFLSEMKREKIIERWVVQYESRKTSRDCSSGSKRIGNASSHSLYKKSIILLRSLYLTVRLLPAFKLFQELNSSGQILTFSLAHRVSSLVEPFTRKEEAEMQQFGFTPVDTSCGRLCLSVLYCPTLSDVNSEPSTPMSPQFIPDYVGSPTTDRLKRFPSLPLTRFQSHGSPSSVPFERRHSWSYDTYRASAPSVSPSPSPTYSDSRALSSNPNSHRLPPLSIPSHPLETPRSSNASLATKNTSIDEFWPSPMLSPSPSPSPPTHNGVNSSKALSRSGSAPVSIPTTRSPEVLNSHVLPPSPPRGTKPGPSQTNNVRDLMRPGYVQTGLKFEKMNSFGKDDVGNIFGAKISSSISPRISFSRGSSRFSSQDMFDYSDFACPFAVDEVDITDPRPGYDS